MTEKQPTAQAEAQTDKRQPMADVTDKVVRYVGRANIRIIRPADWKTAIGREHAEVVWQRDAPLNDVPLHRLDLDPTEFSRCILSDNDFRVVTLGS